VATSAVPQLGRRIERLSSNGPASGMVSVGESAALAAVGFLPASEVMGAVAMFAPVSGFFQSGGLGGPTYPRGWQGLGSDPPPVFTSSTASRVPSRVAVLKRAYRLALARLTDEIRATGADGAVGIRVEHTVVGAGSSQAVWRFLATGTAVRSLGPARAERPFTTSLSAAETATALRGGWTPVSYLACPVMAVRWVEPASRRQERALSGNGEIVAFTETVNACRRQAALDFERDARAVGADAAVMDELSVEVADARDLSQVHVLLAGTALARFAVPRSSAPLSVLSLTDLP
jgi:uncharacterized protein YbjQ (UPF0145 family)